MSRDSQRFVEEWAARFGWTPPMAERLRRGNRECWLRIRYFDDEETEVAIRDEDVESLLYRLNAVLSVVVGVGQPCWVVAPRFDLDEGRLPELPELELEEVFVAEPDDDLELRTPFHGAAITYEPGVFDPLLLAMPEGQRRVVIFGLQTEEAFAPMDLGVDVIACTPSRRDLLLDRFVDWLPT